MSRRTVFFVSDQTGVTAETLGHSLMTQFEGLEFRPVTLPFVSTLDKAHEAVRRIDRTAQEEGMRPIMFSTLVQDELRDVVIRQPTGCSSICSRRLLDRSSVSSTRAPRTAPAARTASPILPPTRRASTLPTSHSPTMMAAAVTTRTPMWCWSGCRASARLRPACTWRCSTGCSPPTIPSPRRISKRGRCPLRLEPFRGKLYALTIRPERLQQIRSERRPDSRYASRAQVQYELRAADATVRPLFDSGARYERVLDRGDRQPHHEHERHRAAPAAIAGRIELRIVARFGVRVGAAAPRSHENCKRRRRANCVNSRADRTCSARLVRYSRCVLLADTTTVVSWRARPRSFVALMGLYESNFIRLGWLAGDLLELSGRYLSSVRGDCDLVLTVTERSPYTSTVKLTYLLPDARGPRPYPDMRVRIYHDAHLVEAQQWQRSQAAAGSRGARRAERELDQRWARNMMLNKWLEYCVERGHRFSSRTEQRARHMRSGGWPPHLS